MGTSTRYLSPVQESYFPGLHRGEYHVTSEADWVYNCIAHAAGKTDAWWWPEKEDIEGVYWPEDLPREETLACFAAAYEKLGYVPCEGPELEPGFEKIALYADAQGVPTHAARQLANGSWTSKLGESEDIEHRTLEALSGTGTAGQGYGRPAQFLKRPRELPPAQS